MPRGQSKKLPNPFFLCGLCKHAKTSRNKSILILIDIQNDNKFQDNICSNCMLQLSLILRYQTIPKEKKQLVLDKWSLEL